MARGRPALATVLMTTGVIALAVPGSVAFAGEFLILAGIFDVGWGWAVVGAVAIVLAAMYMLRLISAVLHRRRGSAVSEAGARPAPGRAGDASCRSSACSSSRPGRRAITERSFPADAGMRSRRRDRDAAGRLVRALADAGAARRHPASRCSARCSCRAGSAAGFGGLRRARGFVAAGVLAILLFDDTPERGELLIASRSPATGSARSPRSSSPAAGALAVLVSWGEKRRDHVGEYYALLAAAGAGMVFFVSASNLMTLFLGLEWFSIALYILCAIDTHRGTSLEAGLKYLVVGSFGSAILLFGSALVYGATGELGFSAIAAAPLEDDVSAPGGPAR